tara:strand:+ start:82 stop:528 length:447 start_codon:yes stop_codon:yes gene_type:complete
MNVKYYEKCHGYFLEDIFVGQEAELISLVKDEDIDTFAKITGDTNPIHINKEFAKNSIFKNKIAHGFLSASYISAVIGTKLPGPGCIYVKQSLQFLAPVYPGDEIVTKVKVKSIIIPKKRILLETFCCNNVTKVLDGEAEILVNSKNK